ncbi:uncharacterized protein TEOVI_000380800 [Trypanosoma equiperdum]|uniref:Uncharacterized protein n=4 Tax=Trypanozoon TaxID=39700 RepID=Q38EE4_TRYB2|nr:hypothetical protein, conserved [Trypanosoma brucei gambiense DAL972]XP_827156.1 hypothetical protein, conserved [Trypanosoma brucei brucei TREU927]RHW70148.1 hypothetical protein DPX39_090043100 [Trypanosoma brucei equiperdum]SCU72232.1 hypothetical protein, conserved [Trypanosoma equiperdum]EAN76826.1 hypothetical protein, conserved [Trypanosoma brucei brucei TREU927]CBH14370.1 hypothetical protein, conserved [Trypanosoma brucei gambiense DAL972]|eukprot:XP_011776636.1 hypothetical protein, conserved [Trypanosoma brucei gambiense DAL972]
MSHLLRSRKPYVPIDTCSPAGTWIEEKHYNKERHKDGATCSRKVLCGNWQEEKVLEDDLLAQQPVPSDPKGQMDFTSTTVLRASLDAIRPGKNDRFTGGYSSTPYVTSDARNPHSRFLQTTNREDYCEKNADLRTLRRPDLGARSRVLLQVALNAAREEKNATEAERKQLTNVGMDGNNVYLSTYQKVHCLPEELPVVDSLCNDYLSDEPITLYTGNPETGCTMTVHGKTPVEPVEGRSRFGRHTYFTERKYCL